MTTRREFLVLAAAALAAPTADAQIGPNQAALRKAEDAWPARARVFIGAGLAAMLAVAAAFFALARLGALP